MTTIATSSPSSLAAPRSRVRWIPIAARILLGLLFLGSGLAGLLTKPPPLSSPPLPEGLVALANGMIKSGYLFTLLKLTETAVGVLLLTNRFVPLALVALAPITVNIVLVHLLLAPSGLPIAAVVLALHVYLGWSYRSAYRPMLAAKVAPG